MIRILSLSPLAALLSVVFAPTFAADGDDNNLVVGRGACRWQPQLASRQSLDRWLPASRQERD